MPSNLPTLPPRNPQQPGSLPRLPERPAQEQGLPTIAPAPGTGSSDRGNALPPIGPRPLVPPPGGGGGAPPPPKAPRWRPQGRGLKIAAIVIAGILAAGLVGALSANIFGPDDSGDSASSSASTPVTPISGSPSIKDAISLASPSVVQVRSPNGGQGSGVVVQPRGLIVTNAHVLQGADTAEVRTAVGTSIEASVAVSDPAQDLAVLQPVASPGPGAVLADETNALTVGDEVFAIGSPFGLQNTVTAGIVSALRTRGGRPLIQFDASVNPGNSGGGLFDLAGRLVGIPTSIESPNGGNVGIAFAVPASRVRTILATVP